MSSIPKPSAQALTWHYLAGPARLCISADGFAPGDVPPCAAEAAVVLDLVGELLDALEAAGLLTDARWQWVSATGAMAGGGAQASWRGTQAEARLSLPWAALRALGAAPEVPGLQWQPTAAECLLAQWHLSDADLAALEPGGLLLLEEAAARQVRARGEAVAGERPWQLVARWDAPLPLDVVMGWAGPSPAVPVLCQLVEATRPDVARARGRLVPWGTGQAFRIDDV